MLERYLGDVAGKPLRPQVDEYEMRVGAAGHDIEPTLDQRLG